MYQSSDLSPELNRINGVAITILSIVTTILAIIPLTTFIKIRQVGPCSLLLISMLFSTFAAVNSRIWSSENQSEWYSGAGICHIETPLRQPLTIAFAFAMVLMPWKLVETLRTRRVVQFNRVWRDIVFVWGVPVFIIMPFQYLVMTNVYSIIPGFGCMPEFDESWLSLLVVFMWWPVLLFLTLVLAIIMGIMIHRKREEISESLNDNSSRSSERTFIKLYIVAAVLIAIYFPTQLIFVIRYVPLRYGSFQFALEKNKEWVVPTLYHTSDDPQIQFEPWAYIAINFLMFLFYGANTDAQKSYWKFVENTGLVKLFPIFFSQQPHSSAKSLLSYGDFVGYVTRKFEKRKDSTSKPHETYE